MEEYSLEKYFKYFFSIYNPFFLALILLLLLFVVVFISYRYIYQPLLLKHRKEKENLELKNAKLLALFVELDPNPIIKIDPEGIIVGMNNSAKSKLILENSSEQKIGSIIGNIDFNLNSLISNNESRVLSLLIDKKYYEVNIYGISLLNLAQLYFYDMTEKKEHIEQMNIYQKLLKDSASRSTKELEQERGKLSAILHDSVGQNLLLLKIILQNLRKHLNGTESQAEHKHADEIIDSTIAEVKHISRSIRPLSLEELGLKTVLVTLCKNISRESHLDYSISWPDGNFKLNDDYESCIYRITQESLNNIIKHSRAKNFSVGLSIDENFVTLIISDDGIGFKPSVLFGDRYISDGMGLMNMQDRVESFNGSFHIDSSINSGTVIIVNLPRINESNEKQYKSTYR
jgi:signal transduction histidine kinase